MNCQIIVVAGDMSMNDEQFTQFTYIWNICVSNNETKSSFSAEDEIYAGPLFPVQPFALVDEAVPGLR